MGRNRILIAEDDRDIAQAVQLNLELSGYECAVFHDGNDAKQHLQQDHAYDLALLDIMLPGVDGFELSTLAQQYHIPVICVTARTDLDSRIRGLRGGAEDYVTKPFEMLELLVRIEKVLERSGRLDRVLRYADITVDLAAHTVLKGDQEVSLQPLEFDLLVMLIRFRNCTLSRDRILDEVWGVEYIGARTVDTHVAQLRRKLGLGQSIVSVPKIGYRLEDAR